MFCRCGSAYMQEDVISPLQMTVNNGEKEGAGMKSAQK